MRGRSDRFWSMLTAALLVAALVVVITSPFGGGDDSPAESAGLLSPVPEGRDATPAGPAGDEAVRLSIAAHDADGGGAVVDGEVEQRLAALRGVPVVVNQWASWCPPCAAEFPFFARLAERYDDRVAFLGLDARDTRDGASGFLDAHPVPFPSVFDPSAKQSRAIGAGRSWPSTVFYDRTGRRTFVKQGGYATQALLDADVRRYALGA